MIKYYFDCIISNVTSNANLLINLRQNWKDNFPYLYIAGKFSDWFEMLTGILNYYIIKTLSNESNTMTNFMQIQNI